MNKDEYNRCFLKATLEGTIDVNIYDEDNNLKRTVKGKNVLTQTGVNRLIDMLVDGYDVNTLDMEYYRAQIGYVMQTSLLFSGTISENIAIGDPNPDRQRLVEVTKLADAHGFINNLSLGYEQIVGERGIGLSGGQIQRICIARALYHDPRLLIFDEATSALDSDSESQIQRNMRRILKGRTAVIIAHRLSTIMNADRILVLYDGAIVEEGTHRELLERKGMYYHLIQKQISPNESTP